MVAQKWAVPQRSPRVAVVGCGYVGTRLSHWLAAAGHTVVAAARKRPEGVAAAPGRIRPVAVDLDTGAGLTALAGCDAVVALQPPPREGERDPRTARLLAALGRRPPQRLIYVSTTGVYGDRGGAWMPETAPVAPATDRARRRWDAEERVRGFGRRTGTQTAIVRASGIYGPGRLGEDRVRSGQALRVAWPERRFVSLIHVADMVDLLVRVLRHGRGGRIFHACDGQPHEQGALPEATARVLGLDVPDPVFPAEARATFSAMRLSFLEESRRCDATRTRQELGWTPAHTDLETAVRASLDASHHP